MFGEPIAAGLGTDGYELSLLLMFVVRLVCEHRKNKTTHACMYCNKMCVLA